MEQTEVDELYQAILKGDVAVVTGILYERERLQKVATNAEATNTMKNLKSGKRSLDSVSQPVRALRESLDRLATIQ